jgi:prevent-host-death family protein
MRRLPATEFKARCLDLMDRVAERRETYVITKRGKAVAKLVPMEWKAGEPLFGRLRDMAEQAGDITRPALPADAWETLREWDELKVSGKAPGRSRRSRRKRAPGR